MVNIVWFTVRVTSKNETDARRASFPKRGGEIRPLTHLAGGFIVLDAAMGALGLKAYLEAQKPSALNLKSE